MVLWKKTCLRKFGSRDLRIVNVVHIFFCNGNYLSPRMHLFIRHKMTWFSFNRFLHPASAHSKANQDIEISYIA